MQTDIPLTTKEVGAVFYAVPIASVRVRALLALGLALTALALFAPRADAMRYGWDWGPGRVGGAHVWIVMSDAELVRASARAAAVAACSRAIGVRFSGNPCGDAVDMMLRTVDWRGWNNRGVWVEAAVVPRRTFIGRW